MKDILILGYGGRFDRRIKWNGAHEEDLRDGNNVTTHDYDPKHEAHFDIDLNKLPYDCWHDETFDEIHAYEVLEHCGTQGDAAFFFDQFRELHRILRPGGLIAISVPDWQASVAWGVPDHKRVLPPGIFTFLSPTYEQRMKDVQGAGDYSMWRGDMDFRLAMQPVLRGESYYILLVKPPK